MNGLAKTYLLILLFFCLAGSSQAQFHTEFGPDTVRARSTPYMVTNSSDTARRIDTVGKSLQSPKVPATIKIKKPRPLSHEMSVGIKVTTQGWGASIDRGKVQSNYGKNSDLLYDIKLWQLDFDEIKSPHEGKTQTTDQSQAGGKVNTYVYGKINNFYSIKLGYGFRKMIGGKPDPGTVSVHWVLIGGPSIGLLKPYYVNSIYNGEQGPVKYTSATHDAFLNENLISGASGFGNGLSEIKIIPGLFLKTALHFDFAASKKTKLAIETGVKIEYYAQPIPLMAEEEAKQFFFGLYAGFQFGKRW